MTSKTGGHAFGFVFSHPVLSVFLLALFVRISAILLVDLFPTGTFALDDSTYSGMAKDVVEQRRASWSPYTHQLYRATFAFVRPLALVYSVAGGFEMAGEMFVAILGAGVASIVTFIALRFTTSLWALVAGAAVALLPSQVLWSSLLLKDPSVWLGLAGLSAIAAIAARSRRITELMLSLIAAGGGLFYLAFLREHTLVVAAWSLPVAMAFSASRLRAQRVAGAFLLTMAVPWIVGIGPAGWTLITNAGSLEGRRASNAQQAASAFVDDEPAAVPEETERVQALQGDISLKRQMVAELEQRVRDLEEKVAAAETGEAKISAAEAKAARQKAKEVKEEVEQLEAAVAAEEARLKELVGGSDIASPEETERLDPDLVHLPKGMFVMLLEPVPWSTEGSTTMRMARLEALLWYPLLALAAIGLVQARRVLWALAFPILAGGGMLLVYALTEGNIGTAYRHRGEFVWVVCLLAGLGAAQIATRRAHRRVETEEKR